GLSVSLGPLCAFFCRCADRRHLHSFPTRRSSDLDDRAGRARVRLRPLHRGQRHAPLQAAVGRRGRCAAVAAMVAQEHRRDPVSGPPGVPLRRGGVATLAAGCHQSDRPAPRAPVALSTLSGWLPRRGATAARGRTASNYRRTVRSPIRCQPPVYSPISWDAARRAAMQGLGWRDDPCPRVERLVRALYRAQETVLLGSGTQALELAIRVATRVAG